MYYIYLKSKALTQKKIKYRYETDIENWNGLIDKFMVCGKVGSWVSRKRTFLRDNKAMVFDNTKLVYLT